MKLITLRLIVGEDDLKGTGKPENPFRRLLKAETLDGILVFEYDVEEDKISMTANLINVLRNAPRDLLN